MLHIYGRDHGESSQYPPAQTKIITVVSFSSSWSWRRNAAANPKVAQGYHQDLAGGKTKNECWEVFCRVYAAFFNLGYIHHPDGFSTQEFFE